MKKRSSIALLTALLAIVFAAGIGVYSNYIGMQIYQESSNHLLESYAQISKTFTLFVQRNWTVLSQWDSLMSNVQTDEDVDEIWNTIQDNRSSWHYSDFYMVNQNSQYLTADGRKGSADSIDGVFQEMYSKGGPIVSTYTATYGVPKIAFAMPMSRNLTLDGVTYTGIAVSYDTDVVDDLVDGSMYGGQSDCYVVRSNGDIVLEFEPQTELCAGMTNLYDLSNHADWKYGSMDDIKDCIQLGKSGSAQFTFAGARNYLVAIPTAFPDWSLVGIIQADEVVYGDNVFEKDGIRRDKTGDGEKTRCLCGKQGIFNRDGPAMGPRIIRQLERRASRRSASFFHALAGPGRPRNGGGAAGAYSPAEGRKTLIQGHFRAQKGPLGPSRKSQQQTKRTGFAALEDSIADQAPEGKRASRANRALIRAEINDRAQKHGGAGADRRGRGVTSR